MRARPRYWMLSLAHTGQDAALLEFPDSVDYAGLSFDVEVDDAGCHGCSSPLGGGVRCVFLVRRRLGVGGLLPSRGRCGCRARRVRGRRPPE